MPSKKQYKNHKEYGAVGMWFLLPILSGGAAFGSAVGSVVFARKIPFLFALVEGLAIGIIYALVIILLSNLALHKANSHKQSEEAKDESDFIIGIVIFLRFISIPIGMLIGGKTLALLNSLFS